jgi:hypothetical protein
MEAEDMAKEFEVQSEGEQAWGAWLDGVFVTEAVA